MSQQGAVRGAGDHMEATDLRTSEVHQIRPIHESSYVGDVDDEEEADRVDDAEVIAADDRWLRLDRAPGGRGASRHWLAESGLRPTVPAEPPSLGRPDLHALP